MYQCYLQSLHIALTNRKIITLKIRLTKEERVKHELHFQDNGSVVSVQINYRRLFGNETSPSKKCIKALVLKFKETGTTEDKPRCSRPRNIRTDASIQRVAVSVAHNPKTSTRRRCSQLGMTRSSLRNVLVNKLKYHPYKIQITQELQLTDYQKRSDFANRFFCLQKMKTI